MHVPILCRYLEQKSLDEAISTVSLSPKQCWLYWKRLEYLTVNIEPGGGESEDDSLSRFFG